MLAFLVDRASPGGDGRCRETHPDRLPGTMLIRIGYDIAYDVPAPVPMLLELYTRPERGRGLVRPEWLRAEPEIPVQEHLDSLGTRCARILASAGRLALTSDSRIRQSGLPDEVG